MKDIECDKKIYPHKKRHRIEKACIFALSVIIVASMSVDFFKLPLPQWLIQKTGNNDIYQTLFSGLASMVGIVMAIIALLMNNASSKVYGLSIARYIMILRPIKPLRHNWIVVEVLLLTSSLWVAVANKLNNLAVSLFFATISLLIYLATNIIKVMHSSQSLEDEVRNYILYSKNFENTINLFKELEKSISACDMLAFQRDITFAKEIIRSITPESMSEANIQQMRDLLHSVVCVTNRTQFSKVSEILDLLIIATEIANVIGLKPASTNLLATIEAYELFGKAPLRSLVGITGEQLLFRWHKVFLANKTEATSYDMSDFSVASNIYHFLRRSQTEGIDKVCIDLLKDTLSFLKSDDIEGNVSEQNYLSFIISLFKAQDKKLLNVLFGFDGRESGFLIPICGIHGDFEFSRTNVFLVMYIYYLAYYENEHIVKKEEKDFYVQLLDRVGKCFWIGLLRRYDSSSHSFLDNLKDSFQWFCEKLKRYERSPEFSYGISAVKTMLYENVTLDFFAFGLTHLCMNTETIERGLKALFYDRELSQNKTSFAAFNRYILYDTYEEYKLFCSVMKSYFQAETEDEYSRLKTAVTNLYRDERLYKAKINNEKFTPMQDSYKKHMTEVVQKVSEAFCSHFIEYDDDDKPLYETYSILEVDLPLGDDGLALSDNELISLLTRWFNSFLLDKIKNKLKLSPKSMKDITIGAFMQNIDGIDADTIIGHEMFSYNDADYKKYADLKNNCVIIEAYGENANINSAINSRLIKISVRNTMVILKQPNRDYINYAVAENKALTVNGYPIELDKTIAADFLRNSRRIINVRLDIAILCLDEIVGGGIEYLFTP